MNPKVPLAIVDENLSPILCRWFRKKGWDAIHVYDLGGDGMADRDIWTLALARAGIVVTKDRDFSVRASRDAVSPKLLWIVAGNGPNTVVQSKLEGAWIEIDAFGRDETATVFLLH